MALTKGYRVYAADKTVTPMQTPRWENVTVMAVSDRLGVQAGEVYTESESDYSSKALVVGLAHAADNAQRWELALPESDHAGHVQAVALSEDSALLAVFARGWDTVYTGYTDENGERETTSVAVLSVWLHALDTDTARCLPIGEWTRIRLQETDGGGYFASARFSPSADKLAVFYQGNVPTVAVIDTEYPFAVRLTEYEGIGTHQGIPAAAAIGSHLIAAQPPAYVDGAYVPSPLLRFSFEDEKLYPLPVTWDTEDVASVRQLAYDPLAKRLWLLHDRLELRDGRAGTLSSVDLPALAQQGAQSAELLEGFTANASAMSLCTKGGGRVKGKVTDVNGQSAARTVEAFSRVDGRLLGRTQSNASDGRYDLMLPYRDPCDVVFRALPGEGLPDLIKPCANPLPAKELPPPFANWPADAVALTGQALPPYQPRKKPRRFKPHPSPAASRPPAPKPATTPAGLGWVDRGWVYTERGYEHVWLIPPGIFGEDWGWTAPGNPRDPKYNPSSLPN